MTVFRVSAVFFAAGLALGALPSDLSALEGTSSPLFVAQAAQGPVHLGPRRSASPPDGPAAQPPSPPPAPENAPEAAPPAGPFAPVVVEALTDIDGDSIGTLEDGNGGLGVDMWRGADRVFVERLVARIPERMRSPALRDLARRVLLTSAFAPPRRSGGPSLLSMRIGALFASGELKAALGLIAAAPVGQIEESLVRTEVEARLFDFDTARACDIVRGPAQVYTGLFWQQASAFCLMLSGNASEAALISELLAERSEAVHPSFFATMEGLAGATPPAVESMREPTALRIAMMRAANLALPPDVGEQASPAALQAVARSPNAPIGVRLAAGEAAMHLGALSPQVLLEIYGAVPLNRDDIEKAAQRGDELWGPAGRALILRGALSAPSPTEASKMLQLGFSIARTKGDALLMYRAAAPLIEKIPPAREMSWFAADAVRALVASGSIEKARGWLSIATGEGADPSVSATLWPFAALMPPGVGETVNKAAVAVVENAADPPDPQAPVSGPAPESGRPDADTPGAVTPEALERWWRSVDRAGADVVSRAAVLFSVLEALSLPVSSAHWALVLDRLPTAAASVPPLGTRNGLRHASRIGSRGAVAGFALAAIGPGGPGVENLPAVEQAIIAFRQVGLDNEARRIALETLVAAGL